MTAGRKTRFFTGAGLLLLFTLWTLAIRFLDIQPIGPLGSAVGFATLNGFVHRLIGVHMGVYTLTDWLGLIPLVLAAGFALLGLCQWIRRKSILKVDRDIWILGIFYAVVMGLFLLFEVLEVNHRPVLIEGVLEASYPSSTTMLSLCILPTAAEQLRRRIPCRWLKVAAVAAIGLLTGVLVVGRIFSGVHWFTDIVGGALLSAGLVTLYHAAADV